MAKTTRCIALIVLLLIPAIFLASPSQLRIDSNTSTKFDDSVVNAIDTNNYVKDGASIVAYANKALIEYAGLSSTKQKRFAVIAQKIAKLRRNVLKYLIQHDPKQALSLSLSPGQRQGLPKFILDLLEARMHAFGDLTQAITEVPPGGDQIGDSQAGPPPSVTSWTARIGQVTRRAFVYGLRLQHQTKFDTSIHGIVLDDLMAIDESPLYQYDLFETVQLGFQPGQIVATSGGLPIPLPDFKAFLDLKQDLLNQILLFGPRPFIQLYAWTTGPKNLLVIRADFSDLTGTLYTDAQIVAAIAEVNSFYDENSQGQTSLIPTVIPAALMLPAAATSYVASGEDWGHTRIRDDALAAARDYDMAMGSTGMYDPGEYDRILVLTPQLFARAIAKGDVGGASVVVSGERLVLPALAHELGHTYGFIHSAFWLVPFGEDPIGPGAHADYGDVWDMMGAPTLDGTEVEPRRRHFNPVFKSLAGWLPVTAFANGTPGGVFRLYRHDAPDAVGLRAIWIAAGDGTTYWLGMRGQFPSNPSMTMGVEVRRVMSDPTLTYGPVQLLDMDSVTLGPAGVSVHHSLIRFQTFEDVANGINIRVANVFEDDVGVYADIVITR